MDGDSESGDIVKRHILLRPKSYEVVSGDDHPDPQPIQHVEEHGALCVMQLRMILYITFLLLSSLYCEN